VPSLWCRKYVVALPSPDAPSVGSALVWIEHHPPETTAGDTETFDLVDFSSYEVRERAPYLGETRLTLGEATWKRITRGAWSRCSRAGRRSSASENPRPREHTDAVGVGAGPEGKGNHQRGPAPVATLPGGDEWAMNRPSQAPRRRWWTQAIHYGQYPSIQAARCLEAGRILGRFSLRGESLRGGYWGADHPDFWIGTSENASSRQ